MLPKVCRLAMVMGRSFCGLERVGGWGCNHQEGWEPGAACCDAVLRGCLVFSVALGLIGCEVRRAHESLPIPPSLVTLDTQLQNHSPFVCLTQPFMW